NDVPRRESDFLGQDAIGARHDLDFAFYRIGLPSLVESHNDDGRAEASNFAGVAFETLFAFLEADRISDAFALDAFQSRFDHRPLRAVDHDRNPGDVRFSSNEV